MQWLRNLKIYQKVLLLVSVFVLFLLSIGYTGYYYLDQMRESAIILSNGSLDSAYAGQIHERIMSTFEAAVTCTVAVSILAVIICSAAGLYTARLITMPVRHLEALMEQVGEGTLSVRDDDLYKDEIGELIRMFNRMVERQARLVGIVQKSAVELTSASEEMAASSQQVTSSTSETAKSMQRLAEEADTGEKSVIEASKALLELSSLVQIARKQSEAAFESSQATAEAAAEGKTTIHDTVERMSHIKSKAVETEKLIGTLGGYSAQIGLITDTITGLARQTNLLALNAAIEAARAGEAGRGFAVVAEEVRKLAEQSDQGARQVADLVEKIAGSTQQAVEAVRESRDEVEQGVDVANRAGESLVRISDAVETTEQNVTGVVKVASEEVATSEKIVNLINTLATVIENTDAHAQEMAATIEEILAATQNVASSAQQASAMANELKAETDIFKV